MIVPHPGEPDFQSNSIGFSLSIISSPLSNLTILFFNLLSELAYAITLALDAISPSAYISYTDDGVATTILGPWDIMIDDTITVYSTYEDNCGYEYLDSTKVIVDNEIQE